MKNKILSKFKLYNQKHGLLLRHWQLLYITAFLTLDFYISNISLKYHTSLTAASRFSWSWSTSRRSFWMVSSRRANSDLRTSWWSLVDNWLSRILSCRMPIWNQPTLIKVYGPFQKKTFLCLIMLIANLLNTNVQY